MSEKKTINLWKWVGISVLSIILLYFLISLGIWLYNFHNDLQKYPNNGCIELPGGCKCEPQRQQCWERKSKGEDIVCPVECEAYENRSGSDV